jgi:hypothetical protein
MWGARSKRQVDPSLLPKYILFLCNDTITIPTLVIMILHVIRWWNSYASIGP